jgi:hypothetical protein
MGPAKWSYFYLYVIIDIFSRRVVGWCVADRESATLFAALFEDATAKHPAPKGQLTFDPERMAPAARGWRARCKDGGETRRWRQRDDGIDHDASSLSDVASGRPSKAATFFWMAMMASACSSRRTSRAFSRLACASSSASHAILDRAGCSHA